MKNSNRTFVFLDRMTTNEVVSGDNTPTPPTNGSKQIYEKFLTCLGIVHAQNKTHIHIPIQNRFQSDNTAG